MIDLTTLPMRAAIGQFSELTDEQIAFALQCGVADVLLNTPALPGEERWEFKDLLKERAKIQAFFSAVWGTAALLGPALGAFLVKAFGWRSVFFVNLPLGALGLAVLGYAWRRNVHLSRS